MAVAGGPQMPGSTVDAAFEEFVRGRSTHLFRLALVLTGWDKAAAEDVLQTALERAYRRRRQLFRDGPAARPQQRQRHVRDLVAGLRRRLAAGLGKQAGATG